MNTLKSYQTGIVIFVAIIHPVSSVGLWLTTLLILKIIRNSRRAR